MFGPGFLNTHRTWEDWVGMALGMLVVLSPWLTGEANHGLGAEPEPRYAILATMLVGILVFCLAQMEYVALRRWEEGIRDGSRFLSNRVAAPPWLRRRWCVEVVAHRHWWSHRAAGHAEALAGLGSDRSPNGALGDQSFRRDRGVRARGRARHADRCGAPARHDCHPPSASCSAGWRTVFGAPSSTARPPPAAHRRGLLSMRTADAFWPRSRRLSSFQRFRRLKPSVDGCASIAVFRSASIICCRFCLRFC